MARQHGCWFNVRATFMHARLGLTDHEAGAELVGQFVHELRLGLHRWGPATETEPAADAALHWICLHEHEADRGHVSTVIMHIPEAHHRDVRAWFGGPFLHGKRGSVRPDAVRLKLSCIPGNAHERRRVWLHAHFLRLLCRGLDPSMLARDEAGLRRPLIDLIGIPARLRRPIGRLVLRQTYSTSSSINAAPQALERRHGFERMSAFSAGAWHRLDEGWEAHEHADRRRWSKELQHRRVDSLVEHEATLSAYADGRHRSSMPDEFSYDPHLMLRSWDIW